MTRTSECGAVCCAGGASRGVVSFQPCVAGMHISSSCFLAAASCPPRRVRRFVLPSLHKWQRVCLSLLDRRLMNILGFPPSCDPLAMANPPTSRLFLPTFQKRSLAQCSFYAWFIRGVHQNSQTFQLVLMNLPHCLAAEIPHACAHAQLQQCPASNCLRVLVVSSALASLSMAGR